jgi:hypothetical protein
MPPRAREVTGYSLELLLLLEEDGEDFVDSDDFDVDEPSEFEEELLAGVELGVLPPSEDEDSLAPDSLAPDSFELLGPLAEDVEDRESLMYQPLPLKTMPTGWMTLRKVPPHCSHVVRGASVKLWRFSMTSLQAVQV